jgi:hypothetical protein
MTTHHKTRTPGRRAGLGTVGHGVRISRIPGLPPLRGSELPLRQKAIRSLVGRGLRHDTNEAALSAFLSRCPSREPSILGSPFPFERHGRFFAAPQRPSIFAFPSQNTPKSAGNYSTLHVERNASQSIENNQSRYALLDTLRGSRGARNCERKISEGPPLHKPQGWATRKDKGNNEKQIPHPARFARTAQDDTKGTSERRSGPDAGATQNERQRRRFRPPAIGI